MWEATAPVAVFLLSPVVAQLPLPGSPKSQRYSSSWKGRLVLLAVVAVASKTGKRAEKYRETAGDRVHPFKSYAGDDAVAKMLKDGVDFACVAMLLTLGIAAPVRAQTALTPHQKLAREIYAELVSINSSDSVGSVTRAAEAMAEFTSCAAASMSRSRLNWMVMRVTPCPLTEVISSMPAMVENCRSSTVATAEAMVSGLAPGSSAVTWMVGKSTWGSVETGSKR